MTKKIFITGTGTDVGKTYVTGLILKKLNEANLNAGYFKAAMSGNDRDEDGQLIPGDAKFVKDISGIEQPLDEMCPYIYENAVSPHLAAKIEGGPVELRLVQGEFNALCRKYDYVVMEGSGGIICPIRFDYQQIMLEDVIKEFGLECVLVADAGLGTINNVVLTNEYMEQRNIGVKGIIFNNYIKDNIMHEDNIKMCQRLTGLNVIAKVGKDDKELDVDLEDLLKIFGRG